MASGQSQRDHERGDLAAISVAVSRAAEGRGLGCAVSSSASATGRFALPMAKPHPCRHCRAGFKPERHGHLRRALETSESCGHDGRSNLAAVSKAMPCTDVGRIVLGFDCASAHSSACSAPASLSAGAKWIALSLVTAHRSRTSASPRELRRAAFQCRRRISAAGPVSLPRRNRSLGQREIAHLPFPRHARLWKHEARRVYVRGRRSGGRQPRREERTSPVMHWLRRWRERDDRHLIKSAVPLPDIDPIEELDRIVSAAQERDAEDERRFERLARPSPARDRRGPKQID
jgi:hypothetical protein